MIGKINIIGNIGNDVDALGNVVKGVELIDIVEQVAVLRKEGAVAFEVTIKSLGGFVNVGFDIYDYLKSIPESVTTIAVDECASIATVIFLAGDKRIANCPLMIHNPWLGGVSGDADQLQEAADDVRFEEDRLIKFYADHTGMDKMALDALMKNETYIYPDAAFKLGFTTELPTIKINNKAVYKAVAKLKEDMSKDTKALMTKMDEFIKSAKQLVGGRSQVKNLSVADESGKTLVITNADGSEITGSPAMGNLVSIDGAVAEGTFVIPEMGITITVVSGAITEVSEAMAQTELETANKKIEELTAENLAMKTEIENSKKDFEDLNTKFSEIENTLAFMQGKTDLPQAKAVFRVKETSGSTLAADMEARRAELRAKRK